MFKCSLVFYNISFAGLRQSVYFSLMDVTEDHSEKILQLLESEEERNIELAFQLCVGLNGNYSNEASQVLRSKFDYSTLFLSPFGMENSLTNSWGISIF